MKSLVTGEHCQVVFLSHGAFSCLAHDQASFCDDWKWRLGENLIQIGRRCRGGDGLVVATPGRMTYWKCAS